MQETVEMGAPFKLQQLLDAAGISENELARRSGVSQVTINAMANQRTTRVDLSTLDAISKAFGCEPRDLLERETRHRAK